MKTSAEQLENSQVKVSVTIPKDKVNTFIDRTYKDLSRRYRIQGFRPGKAPRPVMDSKFGREAILGDATNMALNEYEPKVLNAENIAHIGEPEYKVEGVLESGKDFSYEIIFDVKPSFELSSYEPVDIELPFKEASEAEIQQQIDRFLGYYTKFEDSKSKRMIKKGDFVSLDLKGEGKSAFLNCEDRLYELGSGAMPESFDKEIAGMKPGESKQVSFVPTEGEEALELEVKINKLKDRIEPELNDEFAEQNFGFKTAAEMRDAIKLDIEAQKAESMDAIKEQNAIQALGKRLEAEIPENYKKVVFNDLVNQFMSNLQAQGQTIDSYIASQGMTAEQLIADLNLQAEDVARESLAIDALAKHLGLEVSDKDVDDAIAASGVEDPKATKADFEKQGKLPSIKDYVLRTKAIEWLVENAKVTEVDIVGRKAEEKKTKKAPAKKAADKKEPAKKSSTSKSNKSSSDKGDK